MANQDLEKLATLTFFGLSDALKGALSVQDNLIAGSFPTLEIQVKDREEVPHFFGGINGENSKRDHIIWLGGNPHNYEKQKNGEKRFFRGGYTFVIVEGAAWYDCGRIETDKLGLLNMVFRQVEYKSKTDLSKAAGGQEKYDLNSLLERMDRERTLWKQAVQQITGYQLDSRLYDEKKMNGDIRLAWVPLPARQARSAETLLKDIEGMRQFLGFVCLMYAFHNFENIAPFRNGSGTLNAQAISSLVRHFPYLNEQKHKMVLTYLDARFGKGAVELITDEAKGAGLRQVATQAAYFP